MELDNEISPIDGLNKEQFEKIREQIIEYMKMYRPDGEPIGAYKIMKLFDLKEVAYKAWKAAANAHRMYPDNKHTFSDYWETVK